MNIIVFEDGSHDHFYPISLTRALWDLRTGCFTLRERIEITLRRTPGRAGNSAIYYFTRDYLAPFYGETRPGLRINDYSILDTPGECLFINSLLMPGLDPEAVPENTVWMKEGVPLAARIKPGPLVKEEGNIAGFLARAEGADRVERNDLRKFDFIWNMVEENGAMISTDYTLLPRSGRRAPKKNVTIVGDEGQLYLEEGVKLDPFVFIDVKGGPVVIRKGTVIDSFTRIEGPCCIGENCRLLGAKVRRGCSIGDGCRVGGEVEESIFQGYSNKYHDGFIGHSYIGEWVNLGAMTANSDLKNNYTPVKVTLPDRRVNTGSLKVGCFIGDYTKTSIGTLINTGSSIGVGCMLVHGGALTPRHVPSFSWFLDRELVEKDCLAALIKTCRTVASRRGAVFGPAREILIAHLYGVTEKNRKEEISKWKEMRK